MPPARAACQQQAGKADRVDHGGGARLPISIVVRNEDNELPARQAGATTVINPVSFAGLLLAGSTSGRHIADYMTDLAATGGRIKLNERAVLPQEIGGPLSAIKTGIGLRIYREDRPIGFWEEGAARLQTGDLIIEVTEGDDGKSDK